jgi:hypothetical protein
MPQNLEDHPDHHEEIQMLTPLDILRFYIWDRFFTENFDDITIFYIFLYLYSIWFNVLGLQVEVPMYNI